MRDGQVHWSAMLGVLVSLLLLSGLAGGSFGELYHTLHV
jgi:hypothetical protein